MADDVTKTVEGTETEELEKDPSTTEETPETPEQETPDTTETETPEKEPVESADDLKAKIEALQKENADLKAEKDKDDEDDEEEPATTPALVAVKDPALSAFVKSLPSIRKAFGKAETADDQVDVMISATDSYMKAVMADRQDPVNRGLAQSVIEVANGQELFELLITSEGTVDTKLAKLVPQIKASLKKMQWADRSKPGVVTDIYHKLIGKTVLKTPEGQPAKKPAGPALQATPAVKDAAAGSGTGGIKRAASKVSLTAEQEEERLAIEEEGGHPYPPEKYLASLKALQDQAKQNGRKIPATLRRLG